MWSLPRLVVAAVCRRSFALLCRSRAAEWKGRIENEPFSICEQSSVDRSLSHCRARLARRALFGLMARVEQGEVPT